MPENNEFKLIDESEIEDDATVVALYKELIRIIERDIDDSSPRRDGFTPWTLLAAMGAVLVVTFSIGKGMLDAQRDVVAATFLLTTFVLQWLYFLVNLTGFAPPVKAYRLYYPRQRAGSAALIGFRSLVLVLTFVFAVSLWGWGWIQLIGYLGFAFLGIFFFATILLFIKNLLLGNNPAFRRSSLAWMALINIAYIGLITVSFINLPPVTEANFVSMAVGALFGILTLLMDLYISVISPNAIVTQLSDLRDDIVFRRLDLNGALLNYRRIKEGSLFMEEIAPDFNSFDAKLDERFRNFEMMRSIAQRVEAVLPPSDADAKSAIEGLAAIAPNMESFELAKKNVERLSAELLMATNVLGEKALKLQNASGDYNANQLMWAYLQNKDNFYQAESTKLIEQANQLDARRKELVDRLTAEGHLPMEHKTLGAN